MLLSERQIRDCANTRDAEAELPLLVRRLIGRVATVTALMPDGDAVSSPGWDASALSLFSSLWTDPVVQSPVSRLLSQADSCVSVMIDMLL